MVALWREIGKKMLHGKIEENKKWRFVKYLHFFNKHQTPKYGYYNYMRIEKIC